VGGDLAGAEVGGFVFVGEFKEGGITIEDGGADFIGAGFGESRELRFSRWRPRASRQARTKLL
jgi:hypothetical protein